VINIDYHIHKFPDSSHIPVVFMSTLSEDKVKDKCTKTGGGYFFQKPVDKDDLISKVRELTGNAEYPNLKS
jgi:FixJ family two-component response regulator